MNATPEKRAQLIARLLTPVEADIVAGGILSIDEIGTHCQHIQSPDGPGYDQKCK